MNIVSIIGKPNVGKSTLFNALLGRRDAVVHSTPNLTRDRHYDRIEIDNKEFVIIDTGGIEENPKKVTFSELVEQQVDIAINQSDLILFVVDNKNGITGDDYYIANKLRSRKNDVILVINKCDDYESLLDSEIFKLGFESYIQISAEHKLNISSLKETMVSRYKNVERDQFFKDGLKIAIVGKPNTGKSTIVNALLNENRMIVSDIPGTTMDSIDSYLEYDNKNFVLIDTAGIRRASKIKEPTEYYTILRSKLAMERADVVAVVIDINEKVTFQDKKILGESLALLKPTIVVFNKTDLITEVEKTKFYKEVLGYLEFGEFLPKLFISAKEKKHIYKILEKSYELKSKLPAKFKKSLLNSILFEQIIPNFKHPVLKTGKRPRFYSLTQKSADPIVFILRVNDPENIDRNYRRYIINKIREVLKLSEIPFDVELRSKNDS
ncbi:MAG: ribosome biogenesis GTPase Der [candidate division WOR-3 bacterium]